MDMVAETLMGFRGIMEGLALAREIKRIGCYYDFVIQCTYALPAHGLEKLTRRRYLMAQGVLNVRSIFV